MVLLAGRWFVVGQVAGLLLGRSLVSVGQVAGRLYASARQVSGRLQVSAAYPVAE